MASLRQGLRRLAAGGILLREVRGMRKEIQELVVACQRIATVLEADYVERHPTRVVQPAEGPAVEVSFTTDESARLWMEKELELTRATGRPPSEEEILMAFQRETDAPQSAGSTLPGLGGVLS